jgi:hypothetical protein
MVRLSFVLQYTHLPLCILLLSRCLFELFIYLWIEVRENLSVDFMLLSDDAECLLRYHKVTLERIPLSYHPLEKTNIDMLRTGIVLPPPQHKEYIVE